MYCKRLRVQTTRIQTYDASAIISLHIMGRRLELKQPAPLMNSISPLHWSAHLSRPSSNSETDRHPASKSEEQLDSWAFPQYTQSNLLTNASRHPAPLNSISPLPAPAATMAERPRGKRGKLPKPTTDYLKEWLHRHSDHPYPSEDEKRQQCQATGLSMSQVSNWIINVCPFPVTFSS